jgi:hypothetical protein
MDGRIGESEYVEMCWTYKYKDRAACYDLEIVEVYAIDEVADVVGEEGQFRFEVIYEHWVVRVVCGHVRS